MKLPFMLTWSLVCAYTIQAHSQYAADALPLPNTYDPRVLYVKFEDDLGIYANNQVLIGANGEPVQLFNQVQTAGKWQKMHHLSPEKLQEMRLTASRNLNRNIPDPNSEWYLHLTNSADIQAIKQQLAKSDWVEQVLYVPIPINANPPDYLSNQKYLEQCNFGINAEAVWATYNNRGFNIKVCDIEYSYNQFHLDLPTVTVIGPLPDDPFSETNHGTAVMGQIASRDNGWGTTGIASDCLLYFAGAVTNNTYNLAAAISNAAGTLGEGDVILLEQQIAGPNYTGSPTQEGLIPVEWYYPNYHAILLATGQRITVVEAAGNGGQNLDDTTYQSNNGGHYPFNSSINSGAIIVGAGSIDPLFGGSDTTARTRLWYSNYGSRLDVQGNGEGIYTTGYGDLYSSEGATKYYTSDFGGTSGASPIITGAVTLLQAVHKDSFGFTLSPSQVREYLKNSGLPQQNGYQYDTTHYRIGNLPNVFEAIQNALHWTGTNHYLADNQTINIYPNPNNGQFTIQLPDQETDIYIYNTLGELVWNRSNVQDTFLKIQLEHLADGVYVVQCIVDNQILTKKIILE